MRSASLTLFAVLALSAVGCQRMAEAIIQAGLDEMFEGVDGGADYSPPPSPPPRVTSLAFMTGADSDNVLCFQPPTNTWDLITTYKSGERPIGITFASGAGLLVTTRSGVRDGGSMLVSLTELESSVGATDLGVIAAASGAAQGEVVVAATTGSDESFLVRLDATRGTVVGTTAPRPGTQITGVTTAGDMAVVAEAPLGAIVCYDLTQVSPAGVVLVDGADTVGQPAGMAVSPDGTLLVVSADEPVVQEFDLETGIELDRIRLSAPGLDGLRDIAYDAATGTYLVTAGGSSFYELADDGELIGVYTNPDLVGAASITIVLR